MRLGDSEISLSAGDPIEISPMEKHQMINDPDSDTRFIVISMPKLGFPAKALHQLFLLYQHGF